MQAVQAVSTPILVLLAQLLSDPKEDPTMEGAQDPDRDLVATAPSRLLAKDPLDTQLLRQYTPLNTHPNTSTSLLHNKDTSHSLTSSTNRIT